MAEEFESSGALGGVRLFVGLVQGVLLYALYRAGDAHVWPASEPMLFAALAMAALYVPLVVIQGAGNIRARTLLAWAVGASMLLAGLGAYDRWRLVLEPSRATGIPDEIMPSFALFFFSGVGLFIAQSLIAAGDGARRYIARYETYFDVAWKLGVQLALSSLFVGVFWGVLWLGAGLFELIKLTFLSTLLEKVWFAIPASTLATAAALHLTDVRAGLVAGIRTVALVLLSWLLPLAAVLALGFLVSLLFTGLGSLWETHSASALLLSACATLIVLINTAWQSGAHELKPPLFLRIGGTLAALLLVPLVAVVAYGLWLRVGQHGWTEERIHALACLVIAACYAFGYGAVALSGTTLRRNWLAGLASVNIAAAFAVLAVLLALFSPLADPMRLAVSDQVARLDAGSTAPDQFDYAYLRWDAGRFGREALDALAKRAEGPNAAAIRAEAKTALALTSRYAQFAASPSEIARRIRAYPRDRLLPQSLLRQDWNKEWTVDTPPCLTGGNATCDAFEVEINGAPPDQYVFVSGEGDNWRGVVLGQDDFGHWSVVGRLSDPHCKGALEAMRAGQYAVVAPIAQFRAIEAGGSHFEIEPVAPPDACPK